MSTSPHSGSQQARQALADRLREIRLDAGLTARAIAEAAGWHESKCSRIEHARTLPSDADIRAWCTACDAQDQINDLIATSRAVDSMYVEWRRLQKSGLRRLQDSKVPLYEATRHFRVYCSHVIPGFLQTSEYAHALLAAFGAFHGVRDDTEKAVAARIARSRVLYEGNRRFALLVEESVLRYRIGDAEVMAGQLAHLLTVMSLPSISLGVIPFTAERRIWALEGFNVFDEDLVQVELLTASLSVTQPSEVALYKKGFAKLAEVAVYGLHARALITAASETVDPPHTR
ncbi:helix-turn-helix domain-containing protein [Streptosporangium sp. NBC_01495]|uniref:helix-turn-helix domain-containing protein n=1 Tax=Streptosporangium sp. NBC_01495 TaxID=2903899 RepID=UPI002E371952|nr:helix-turn-helix transcriptional regulator [Streptosporangium sp. NBC_01495]